MSVNKSTGAQSAEAPEYQVDTHGYLLYSDRWTREIAQDIARNAGIVSLTDEHWKAIEFARDYFQSYDTFPRLQRIMRFTGFDAPKLTRLFPPNAPAILAKVAGLPNAVPTAGYDKAPEAGYDTPD